MSDREEFEIFMNEKHPKISLDRYSDPIGAAEFGRNFGDYRVPLVRYLWEFFTLGQAARESEGGSVPSLLGLSAFEVKAIAQELQRAAHEHSDGDDDYPLDVQIIDQVIDDDGSVISGPILCIRDSDYPEEGVYTIPNSQEVRDRYSDLLKKQSESEGGEAVENIGQVCQGCGKYKWGINKKRFTCGPCMEISRPVMYADMAVKVDRSLSAEDREKCPHCNGNGGIGEDWCVMCEATGKLSTPQPDKCISDVIAERKRQDEKWGGPAHDDQKSPNDFVQHIEDYAGWARVMAGMGGTEGANKYRRRMVQVAALAVAAVEAMDRAMTIPAPPEQESE